jgi:hypothetical protein
MATEPATSQEQPVSTEFRNRLIENIHEIASCSDQNCERCPGYADDLIEMFGRLAHSPPHPAIDEENLARELAQVVWGQLWDDCDNSEKAHCRDVAKVAAVFRIHPAPVADPDLRAEIAACHRRLDEWFGLYNDVAQDAAALRNRLSEVLKIAGSTESPRRIPT